jgi:hypothetical protein
MAAILIAAPVSLWPQAPPVKYDEHSPINKFIPFGRTFFKNHRGSVLRHWMEKYHNSNSELDGEWHTELHRGFRFEFIRGDRYTKDELGSVVITDPTIPLPLGLALGDNKEKVLKILGPAAITKEDSFEYELSFEMCFLTMRFTRGRLIEIEISYDHE